MPDKTNKAVEFHKSGYPCSAAVMCAFADDAGISEEQAFTEARPFAGGSMVTCGAVLAAEQVLKDKLGEEASAELRAELERRFIEKNTSVVCRELKGFGTGKVLRPCRGCVTDAAEILEELLAENK